MNQSPVFSVVIPTYNRENFILKTLNTVFNQTYPHYEILVVDNCSTDRTAEILQPLIEAGKIRFIQHDQNYERARSRNTGMDNATGDFVTLLDSDDLMYPTNLEDAARFIETHPDIKFFQNLYQLVDGDNNVLYNFDFPKIKDQLKEITSGNFVSCIGVFIHRDIYQHYRFDTNPLLTSAEDWEYWLRVAADFKIGRIEKINNGIVHHGERSVKHLDLEPLRRRLSYIVEKMRNDPHLSQVYGKYLKRLEVYSLIYMATVANSNHQYKDALKILREAVAKDWMVATSTKFMRVLRVALLKIDKGL
jgi:glycosyltransferase involved in cell wall biosynthesis